MSGHTPGPWDVVRQDEVRIDGRLVHRNRLTIFAAITPDVEPEGPGEQWALGCLYLDTPPRDESEVYANARLIAAAPELRDFAESVLDRLTDGRRELTADAMAEMAEEARAAIAKANGCAS